MAENRLIGKLSSKKGMLGVLNNKIRTVAYKGVKTDTIEVVVDAEKQLIYANLLKAVGGGSPNSVRYDVMQALTDIQKHKARVNIDAVEANPIITSGTDAYRLVKHDSKGLIVESKPFDKDDVPSILNGTTFNGETVFNSNILIKGNIIQQGAIYELHGTKVFSKNDYIFMREGAKRGLDDTEYTGLIANNYDSEGSYGALIYDNKGVARVGDVDFQFEELSTKPLMLGEAVGYYYVDDLERYVMIDEGVITEEQYAAIDKVYKNVIISAHTQPLATREENPTNGSFAVWDEDSSRFITKTIQQADLTDRETLLNFRGEFSDQVEYKTNDIVFHNGYIYRSTEDNNIANEISDAGLSTTNWQSWNDYSNNSNNIKIQSSEEKVNLLGTANAEDGYSAVNYNADVYVEESNLHDKRGLVAADEDLTLLNNKVIAENVFADNETIVRNSEHKITSVALKSSTDIITADDIQTALTVTRL